MRIVPITLALAALVAAPTFAQKRVGPKKEPTFPEAVEQARKAFDSGDFGAAVSALQAAMQAVQKKQRVAILEALPKPAGWTFEDEAEQDQASNPFAAGMAVLGLNIQRKYRVEDGSKRMDVDITANSPMVQMMSMLFANPAMIQADGGELVEYGAHKAILKKQDEDLELTIVMHNKHIVKVDASGMSVDDLFAIFNQALVDRLEKPLGK